MNIPIVFKCLDCGTERYLTEKDIEDIQRNGETQIYCPVDLLKMEPVLTPQGQD